MWHKYFGLEDEQQKNPATGKAHFQNKAEMRRAIEAMEADELVVVSGDDVVITS